MWLVLCEEGDESGAWVSNGLRENGLTPLERVTSEHLAKVVRWEHRVSNAEVRTEIELKDGRMLRNDQICRVISRLTMVPAALTVAARPDDREYASQEFTAFFMSWLRSLRGPVLNPPTARGLSGGWRHPSEWLYLGSRAGLDTRTYRQSSRAECVAQASQHGHTSGCASHRSVFVVGAAVLGESLPVTVAEGCRRLAALCECPLLGLEFEIGAADRWVLEAASASPDLRPGADELVHAMASALRADRGRP